MSGQTPRMMEAEPTSRTTPTGQPPKEASGTPLERA